MNRIVDSRWLWLAAAVAAGALRFPPALALFAGAAGALLLGNSRQAATGRLARQLLQAAVVLMGFGLPVATVLRVGARSLPLTLVSITLTMAAGFLLARLLRVERDLGTLLSGGTAICGGSAIAALAPAIAASAAHTGVALAIVFVLNGIALLVFPALGHLLGLDQAAFGLWSALAIHDTSSVVGAAAVYGPDALAVATTVKLTRALWILPVTLACARGMAWRRGKGSGSRSGTGRRVGIPWFLGGFLLAAGSRSALAAQEPWWDFLAQAGHFVMVVTLFLIGAGLTRANLRTVGGRGLLMAVLLWLLVSGLSLLYVLTR